MAALLLNTDSKSGPLTHLLKSTCICCSLRLLVLQMWRV